METKTLIPEVLKDNQAPTLQQSADETLKQLEDLQFRPVTQKYIKLRKAGYKPEEAYPIASGKDKYDHSTLWRIEQKYHITQEDPLVTPEAIRTASNTIIKAAKGRPDTIEKHYITKDGDLSLHKIKVYPSKSDQLKASEIITDRAHPVVERQLKINANIDIKIADLGSLK